MLLSCLSPWPSTVGAANRAGRRALRVQDRPSRRGHGPATCDAARETDASIASHHLEPTIGQIKGSRGARRFMRRGIDACASEWKLISGTHNLLKLWRHQQFGLA